MSDLIRIQFTPTPQDFTRPLRAVYLRQRSTWIILSTLTIVFLFGAGIFLLKGFQGNTYAIFYILLLPVYVFFFFLFNPWLIGLQARSDERLKSKTTWEVDAKGVRIRNKALNNRYKWDSFYKVIETDQHYLLFPSNNKKRFEMIPKRAFESPEQQETFREYLRNKIESYS